MIESYDGIVGIPYDDYKDLITSQITLRDFFAGCALIGFVRDNPNWKGETYAPWCFELADALIKEREK